MKYLTFLIVFIAIIIAYSKFDSLLLYDYLTDPSISRIPFSKTYPIPKRLIPIVYFNPLTGVGLEAQLTNVRTPNRLCYRNHAYYHIWIDPVQFYTPWQSECFVNNFRMHMNRSELVSTEGVVIRPVNFGGTESLRFIDKNKQIPYLDKILKAFERHGYVSGKTFRGAQYDFRKTPHELIKSCEFENIKRLIEETSIMNGNIKVHVMGHSYGGPIANYFLANFVSQEWKDRYIESFIPMGSPYDGSYSSLMVLAGNALENAPGWIAKVYQALSQNIGAVPWMIPSRGDLNHVFLSTPTKNYTLAGIKALFDDLKLLKTTFEIWQHVSRFNKTKAPNVPVHCVYPVGIKTPTWFRVEKLGGEILEAGNYEDGDGAVLLRDLIVCDQFATVQNPQRYPVKVHRLVNSTHGMVNDDEVVDTLLKITLK